MPSRAHADEARHADAPVECWWWWGSAADGSLAWFVGLELRGRRFDYWAGLARVGLPYLYVEELDGTGLRSGLELKPPEMWADHDCEVPFERWVLGNEAHGVLLDDPSDALGRAYGERAPVAFDVEWCSTDEAQPASTGVTGADGYSQTGVFDARIEVRDGVLAATGPAWRLHQWGIAHRPDDVPPAPPGLFAPYRRGDGTGVRQVATLAGWWARTDRLA